MLNVSSMKKMSLNMKSTIGGIGALNNRKEQFKVSKSSRNVKMSLIYVLWILISFQKLFMIVNWENIVIPNRKDRITARAGQC